MDEQYQFDFKDWKEAFETFYRKRCGHYIEVNGKKYKREGNPQIVFIVSTDENAEGYWVEEKGQNTKTDAKTKVYRSVKAVKEFEKEIKEKYSRLKSDWRRVIPRAAFQPPETCPECIAGIPFDENHKHVRSA